MDLDVSPDGRSIAFSLLGDIDTLPIGGGAATRLTKGLAWDTQPRLSPDGRTILFERRQGGGLTSGRASDNPGVWRMASSGGPVTRVVAEGGALFQMDMNLIADGNATLEHNVPVSIGGRGQQAGIAPHREWWSFARGGMTPVEALTAGTREA